MSPVRPTPDVYRQPVDATTARVFSDPPMNFLQIEKPAARSCSATGQSAPATGQLARWPTGSYIAGFRPNHLEIGKHAADAVEVRATLT